MCDSCEYKKEEIRYISKRFDELDCKHDDFILELIKIDELIEDGFSKLNFEKYLKCYNLCHFNDVMLKFSEAKDLISKLLKGGVK